jgi:protein phosphatase
MSGSQRTNKRIRYEAALRSVVGTRDEQQDCAYVRSDSGGVFAVVCDGMGGMGDGGIASVTAVEKLKDLYFSKRTKEAYHAFFLKAVDILDERVFMLKDSEGGRRLAGTTIVAIAIENEELFWMSVGDSRLYILRKNEIARVTRDHNYLLRLDQMMREKSITKTQYDDEAPKGEALISYIGIGGVQVMDINEVPFPLLAGDAILLASDGLYRFLGDEEILPLLQAGGAADAADALIRGATEKAVRFQDNTTCVVVKCIDTGVAP